MDFIVGLISPAAHEELEVEHLDKLQQINNTVTANGDSMSNHREKHSRPGTNWPPIFLGSR